MRERTSATTLIETTAVVFCAFRLAVVAVVAVVAVARASPTS